MDTARDLFEDAKVLEAQADMLDGTPEECTCSPDGRYTCPTCRDFAYTFFGE